jgi:hypothetical protein
MKLSLYSKDNRQKQYATPEKFKRPVRGKQRKGGT